MFSLSSLFPSMSTAPAAASTPAAEPAAPAAPAAPTAPTAPAAPTSPLDSFTQLWQNPTNADGTPVAPRPDPLAGPVFNFDPKTIAATANKLDFMANIPQDSIAKALGGDAAAFAAVINQAVRGAVTSVTVNSGNLINAALTENNQRLDQALPTRINRARLLDSTGEENPVLSHPAAAPLVNALKQMAFAKNPDASPAAVSKEIGDYLTQFSSALVDSTKQVTDPAPAEEHDWRKWGG